MIPTHNTQFSPNNECIATVITQTKAFYPHQYINNSSATNNGMYFNQQVPPEDHMYQDTLNIHRSVSCAGFSNDNYQSNSLNSSFNTPIYSNQESQGSETYRYLTQISNRNNSDANHEYKDNYQLNQGGNNSTVNLPPFQNQQSVDNIYKQQPNSINSALLLQPNSSNHCNDYSDGNRFLGVADSSYRNGQLSSSFQGLSTTLENSQQSPLCGRNSVKHQSSVSLSQETRAAGDRAQPRSHVGRSINSPQQEPDAVSRSHGDRSISSPRQEPDAVSLSRRTVNIMEERLLIPPGGVNPPAPHFHRFAKRPNCHKDIMRCTMNALPGSEDVLSRTRLPLGILIQPFTQMDHIPVVRANRINRCRTLSCRAYLNPFVVLTENRRRWQCNLCLRVNELSDITHFGLLHRCASVEYIAPQEGNTNGATKDGSRQPLLAPLYLFLVDLGASVPPGTIQALLRGLANQLDHLPGAQRAKFCIIGYDHQVHLYRVGVRNQELVVSDLSLPLQLPSSCDLVVGVWENMDQIRALLLEEMPQCVATPIPSKDGSSSRLSCLGTALLMAKAIVAQHTAQLSPGQCQPLTRITIVNGSTPTVGEGQLPNNNSDHKKLAPSSDFYKTLSLELVQCQIAVDLLQLGESRFDLASLAELPRYSGGCLLRYLLADAELGVDRLTEDWERYLARPVALDAVLRVRYSPGLAVKASHGSMLARAADLYSLAVVRPDWGLAVRLGIDETGLSEVAFVQAALLYTCASTGQRRIRVHTLCLPVASRMEDVLRMADSEAVATLLAKTLADRLSSGESGIMEAREALQLAITDCSLASQVGIVHKRLLLPYHLRLLPLLVWSLLRMLSSGSKETVAVLSRWRQLGHASLLLAPVLYRLDDVELLSHHSEQSMPPAENAESCCSSNGDSSSDSEPSSCSSNHDESRREEQWQPVRLQLSSAHISGQSVYLLDQWDGITLLIGQGASPELVRQVLGVARLSELGPQPTSRLPVLDHPGSRRLRRLVAQLQARRGDLECSLSVLGARPQLSAINRQLLSAELRFALIEDDSNGDSYTRFVHGLARIVMS